MVECMHTITLLSLELAVLTNSLPVKNILAIYMFLLVLILVRS
jgi:hypothetical protein